VSAVGKTAENGASTVEESAFGDIEEKIQQAIAQAVADRRRHGLPIAVAKGDGIELIP
jgi:hypothetical protein